VGIEEYTAARDRLLALAPDADLRVVLQASLTSLHAVTRFTQCAVMTVDPETMLPTGGVVEGFSPDACAPFWDHELLVPGFNKFNALARSHDTVVTLVEATDGDLERAPIYNELYAPLGVADEMRIAFVLGGRCWGVAALVRPTSDGPFPNHEVHHVRGLAPLIARAIKTTVCRLDTAALGTGAMLVVDRTNAIRNVTVQAGDLLDRLRTGGVDEPGLPVIIGAVATKARSSRTSSQVATRVRDDSGRWLRVTAMPMEGSDGSVAVTIEPARAADLTPILIEGYGFTAREAEIVMLLARGLPTKDMAADLSLSPHTVRDHVKVIFDKAGVNSRGELIARLFAQHLLDGFHSAVHRAT
jgi:DNA-binding CsgD family transcriptional regulator